MLTILISIPTTGSVSTTTFKSLYDLAIPRGYRVDLEFIRGYSCEMARNNAVKYALEKKYDYVFFVDSDMVLPKRSIKQLLQHNKDITCGYYVKKIDGDPITELFKPDIKDGQGVLSNIKESELPKNSLVRVMGCGFGCVLIKTSVFEKILADSGDDFCFKYIHTKTKLMSEDLYFCEQAFKHQIGVYCDTSLRCGHIGKKMY